MTKQFKIGDRVILTTEYDVYPLGIWKAGETGTITSIRDNLNGETGFTYMVKLDNNFPVLNEWNNKLQIDDREDSETPFELLPHGTVNLSAIKMDDIGRATQINDVDVALKSLMDIAGITTGDIAGIVFSGFDWAKADQWSRVEQIAKWIRTEKMCSQPE